MLLSKASIFVLLVFCLFACKQFDYRESYIIDTGEWHYGDKASFLYNVQDTTIIYNIILEIEHALDYQYQNLYVKIHTGFPNGERREDVISFDLADKLGKWEGECSGSDCKVVIDLQKGAFFMQLGTHTFFIEQFMRKESLSGINRINFIVEKIGRTK